MWIPHRVFFANLAFIVATVAGVLLLAVRVSGWRGWAQSVAAPALVLGCFIGVTATRGEQLRWWERGGIALWVAAIMGGWLTGAAIPMGIIRQRGGSWRMQVMAGGFSAAILFLLTRAILRR